MTVFLHYCLSIAGVVVIIRKKDSRIKCGNDNFFYTPAVHCRVKPTNDSSFFFTPKSLAPIGRAAEPLP